MTTATAHGNGRTPWRIAAWGGAAALWLLPAVAMQFTDEVTWTAFDFILFGAMLGSAAGAFELLIRMSGSLFYRTAAAIAMGGAFLLTWVNLAVGIIGDEGNPANLMYGGVLAAGVLGAVMTRFRAKGMAHTLFAMAATQFLIGAVALAADLGAGGPIWPRDVLGLTGFFVVLWLVAGFLFRNAAEDEAAAA
jgi:hypothetical protein